MERRPHVLTHHVPTLVLTHHLGEGLANVLECVLTGLTGRTGQRAQRAQRATGTTGTTGTQREPNGQRAQRAQRAPNGPAPVRVRPRQRNESGSTRYRNLPGDQVAMSGCLAYSVLSLFGNCCCLCILLSWHVQGSCRSTKWTRTSASFQQLLGCALAGGRILSCFMI